MLLTQILNQLNKALAGERLTLGQATPYIDYAIDQINSELGAIYPTLSDIGDTQTEYSYFPDQYIRTVVIPCAAWRFYVMDEEGLISAEQYHTDYLDNMFIMKRDMLYAVPVEYQVDPRAGSILGNPYSMSLGFNRLDVQL